MSPKNFMQVYNCILQACFLKAFCNCPDIKPLKKQLSNKELEITHQIVIQSQFIDLALDSQFRVNFEKVFKIPNHYKER